MSVTANMGMRMPAWFDIYEFGDFNARQDRPGLLRSVATVHDLIRKEIQTHGISSDRVVVGGFSQGCAIALLSGLMSDVKLGGIVGLSGFVPLREDIMTLRTEANKSTKILLCHGLNDPLMKLHILFYSYGALTELESSMARRRMRY